MSVKQTINRAFTFVALKGHDMPGTNPNNNNYSNNGFNWKSAVLDATIIAGLNFFSTLSAIGAMQLTKNPVQALLSALISAGFGFFSTLAVKRGLKKS